MMALKRESTFGVSPGGLIYSALEPTIGLMWFARV